MAYISTAYYPASLVFYPMESNLGYRPGVSKEVFACLDDERWKRLYRDICDPLVMPAVTKRSRTWSGSRSGRRCNMLAGLTFCKMIKETFRISMWWWEAMSSRGCRKSHRGTKFFRRSSTRPSSMKGSMRCSGSIKALNRGAAHRLRAQLDVSRCVGVQRIPEVYTEKTTSLPCRISTGCHWDRYFRAGTDHSLPRNRRSIGAAARSCDHDRATSTSIAVCGHMGSSRSKRCGTSIIPAISFFSDESYPPALAQEEVLAATGGSKRQIEWTTLIRFEETLQDQEISELAAKAGCCTLYYGMESANERVLNLMDHTKKSVIQNRPPSGGEGGDLEPRDGVLRVPRRDARWRWRPTSSSSTTSR